MIVISACYGACDLIELWINAAGPKSFIWHVCVISWIDMHQLQLSLCVFAQKEGAAWGVG